ncbi:hypothetical protein J3A83DRAFT_4095063 [Scleroderma citrinum]
MSEDDRAAKAARAKALLKKRQQKKTGGSTSLASPPPSRSYTPALADSTTAPTEEGKADRDINDLFSPSESDANWVESLAKANATNPDSLPSSPQLTPSKACVPPERVTSPTPSAPLSSLPPATRATDDLSLQVAEQKNTTSELHSFQLETNKLKHRSTDAEQELSEALIQIDRLLRNAAEESRRWEEQDQNRQQTISFLVSEKASLTSSLERMEAIETELQEKENLLTLEQARTQDFSKRVHDLEAVSIQKSDELRHALQQEKELTEKCHDQEREIQLRKAELGELQASSEQHQQRIRELEEQIENDDRADRLEVSLKNTQDRADELEFQLSKLKQIHSSLKGEMDGLDSQLRSLTDSEAELKSKHSSLEEEYTALQARLESVDNRQNELLEERASLQSQVQFNQNVVRGLQQKLGELAAEVSSRDRNLSNLQGELRATVRRAEESEKTQRDLQAEGITLVQSLEEMRPKIAELTTTKAELLDQIERLEHDKKSRDTLISRLEIALNEGTEREAEAAKLKRESDLLRERDITSLQQTVTDLQRGYAVLEVELQESQTAVHTLEAERTKMRQAEMRQTDLSNRLSVETRRKEEEISHLETELVSQRNIDQEQRNLIDQYRSEIEVLRSDLMAREEELESFQKTPVTDDAPGSLDGEMLSALKQQHVLELSSANSQIRALETAVFEAQDRAHRLQRQVGVLEDQLAQTRTSRATPRPFSPSTSARSSSRASSGLRRASFGKQSGLVPPSTRSVFDVGLSPETRHKRQVSLSMLKARIESEAAANGHTSRVLSPVLQAHELSLSSVEEVSAAHPRRPQFMDELHIFWCRSCRGDLVIL